MTIIRALTQADLPAAQRIVRVAFGTFLGAPDPEQFWSDLDYVYGRFGAEHTAAFAAENDDGLLAGSNFVTRWGSVGFFGPLTTRPDLWDGGIGQRLARHLRRWRDRRLPCLAHHACLRDAVVLKIKPRRQAPRQLIESIVLHRRERGQFGIAWRAEWYDILKRFHGPIQIGLA